MRVGDLFTLVCIPTCLPAYSIISLSSPHYLGHMALQVSVNKAVWVPATLGLVMKIITGLLGAWALWLIAPDGTVREGADDVLNILVLPYQPKVTRYSAFLWDITTLIPGIPVLAIMVRYNLLSGKVCGRFWSFFWGVVAPWIVTMFCYEADILVRASTLVRVRCVLNS